MFNVLAIGYGRQLFDAENKERQRMIACAKTVASYHIIVFTKATDGLSKVEDPSGLVVHPTNSKNKLMMIFDAIRLGKEIIKNQSGEWVITSQDPFEAGLVGYRLARIFDFPLNIQEHGDFFSTPYWKRDTTLNQIRYRFGKWLLRRATTVRVVSERIKKTMLKLGLSEAQVLSLPVRSDQIKISDELSYDYGFGEEKVVILTMARLEKQKNLSLMLRAFAQVYQKHNEARLVIIGRGSQRQYINDLVNQLGLRAVVKFLEWTDEPGRHYQAADIYALSSDWEGWARVLVEAMAYGLPIVTTDVGCVGEVVQHEKHGLVVPVRDEAAFAASLERLVADQDLRNRLAKSTVIDINKLPNETLEDYAQSWSAVLENTLAVKRG